MLKDYEIDKPVLETDRLIIRTLNEADVPDLKEWLGRDEIYTYWGRKASKNEKNPELMFIDARPWVKRKPSLDFDWGIVLKESNIVIGMIAVFDISAVWAIIAGGAAGVVYQVFWKNRRACRIQHRLRRRVPGEGYLFRGYPCRSRHRVQES